MTVLRVFLIAGEESGDQLGGRLMESLVAYTGGEIEFSGVGGSRMIEHGLQSLFPMRELSVMGIAAVVARLPQLLRRISETTKAVLDTNPDVLVLIDAPDFTHRVAKRVRKARPELPIIDYVSPTVWAWRPGRAAKMAAYVDHLLALLPFEPEVHQRLGGPPTSYVGHPLIDKPELLTGGKRAPIAEVRKPSLILLPGSRGGELDRHLPVFRATLERLGEMGLDFQVTIPTLPRFEERLTAETADWDIRPQIVTAEKDKFAAFRKAHAALAVSGTVTLELGLAGVPMVVAYIRDRLFKIVTDFVRRFPDQIMVSSMVLPNIILGENIVPEFLDPHVDAARLAGELAPLLRDTPDRADQVAALSRLWQVMAIPGGYKAADLAAGAVLDLAGWQSEAEQGG